MLHKGIKWLVNRVIRLIWKWKKIFNGRPVSVRAAPIEAFTPIPTTSIRASQPDDVTPTANSHPQPEVRDEHTTIQQDIQGNRNPTVGQMSASGEHNIAVGNAGRDVYIGVKPKWTGKPFQAPPLPPYFVKRLKPLRELKKLLLETEETTPGTLVVSAIYGLGGIGKSVLATALAYDHNIRERFADGTLWVTLGQQPDILSLLSGWIQALGDFDYKPTTPQAASTHLRTLLYDKCMLLVVDDAWKSEDVEPFQVGGSNCRVLVTTREAPVRGAIRYDLDMMSPAEALELLNKCRLGTPMSEKEQGQALDLAKALGYLPLALELAAAQVAEGVNWSELLEDFQAEVARLETLDDSAAESASCEQTRKHLSLKASFNLSLRQLSPEQLQQFAWLGVLPEDVSIGQETAAVLWQVKPRQAGAILRTLRSKALLLSGAVQPGEKPTYRIHDLMHDRAKELLTDSVNPTQSEDLPGLGLTLKEAHAAFLERYRAKTENGQWYTLSNDGYIHNYLTWHLEQAGHSQELHQLLQASTPQGRNAWYEVCDRLGKLGNFVTDVARAWQLAEQMYEEKPSESIGLQCRYALIIASLNSLAENIPAELIAALVEKQVWTPEQGLAYAQQKNGFSQAEAIEKLAPHLPERVLTQALEAARAMQDESNRAYALSTLVSHLPDILPEALDAVQAIQNEFYRNPALSYLAPHLPGILPEALDAALAIQDEYTRASALGNLAAHLPETLLPKALEVARTMQQDYCRAEALSNLAPHLPDILPEALDAVQTIQNNEYAATFDLSRLAPHLPETLLPKALEVARAMQQDSYRAYALSKLAPHLPDILPEALDAARATQEKSYRAYALSNLASHFPEIQPEALDAAQAIPYEGNRADALSKLVAHLPETLLPKALDIAQAIQDEGNRSSALSKFAVHLPEILPEALNAARAVRDKYTRARTLGNLAAHLPDILPEALNAARAIQDEYYRAQALGIFAAHLPDILPEALDAVQAVQDEYYRAYALSNLAPHLPETLLPKALEVARAMQQDHHRAKALSNLTPRLPEILPEALNAVRALQSESEYTRAETLSNLAALLPDILPEALNAALAVDDMNRPYILSYIAPHLPENLLLTALDSALAIQETYFYAEALSNLAPYLPENLFSTAFDAAKAIQNKYYRAKALSGFLPQLKLSYFTFSSWKENLRLLAYRNRKDLLTDISALSHIIIALGGKEALAATARAIQEVGRQWT